MKKIVLIAMYFGSFPEYFQLFLRSCALNPQITWLIYTDQVQQTPWPSNVRHIGLTFEQCRERFQEHFDFPICLDEPKKLCDYRPAIGSILADDLRGFDFWGSCDLDVIWGDIGRFLQAELLDQYDKLYALGHFALYRNTPACNRLFYDFDGGKRSKEVFGTPMLIGFDEWGRGNINEVFKASAYSFYDRSFGADVWPEQTNFALSEYRAEKDRYAPIEGSQCVFFKSGAELFQVMQDGRRVQWPYVHMQKRDFKVQCAQDAQEYWIVPGAFLPAEEEGDHPRFFKQRCRLMDGQFFRIKRYNLKRRLELIRYRQ